MHDTIRQEFLKANDPFRLIIEYPGFYTSAESFNGLQNEVIELVEQAQTEVRDLVLLALAYTKRLDSEDSCDQILADVRAIADRPGLARDTLLTARTVEGVLLVTRGGQLTAGLTILETVRNELRHGASGILYGVVQRWLAFSYMYLGRVVDAEIAHQDAISTARRYEMKFLYATALNDFAVHKKRRGEYLAARDMLREALRYFDELGVARSRLMAIVNLGNIAKRLGNWSAAESYFRTAIAMLGDDDSVSSRVRDTQLQTVCMTTLEHLLIQKRQFAAAEKPLLELVQLESALFAYRYIVALAHEFLGELYTETNCYEIAYDHFNRAEVIAKEVLPESDVVTELLRRRAELCLNRGDMYEAKGDILRCLRLARRIGDRYEFNAAIRVLAEIHAAEGNARRANACFASAVRGLKRIHECYELMRTLYAQGKFLATHGKQNEAEIALLEARQLAKTLDLDYYQALVAVAVVDLLVPQERWNEARAWLQEATALRDTLEGIDHSRVEKDVQRAANELQIAITRVSVREAETLKTICRVYEDARFPIVEMRADLAYQVAQSAGGASLFLAARKGGGYHVPLTYNIAVNDAKELVRRFDEARKDTFLKLNGEARVLALPNNCTLVAIPCQTSSPRNPRDRSTEIYALCTCFDKDATVGPRQIEILCASAEALVRLVDDEEERHAKPSEEEISRARHPRGSFKDILTIDPGMIKVIKLAEKAASSVAPILLQGETGVGKELFARAIHESSKRKDGPFVAVNAGGMPVALLESELFGHVKGAFTDAGSDRQGFVDTARGGTLFLDEIGEMGEELQVKLLRLLENGEYRRLGESSMRKADVRVVSATNKELSKEVERGKFRRDLYYRVSPLRLTIPPLRLRAVDIQLMVRHFLRDCARMNGIGDRMIEIDVKAMEALELYDWPGNVRELHNEILRVVSLIGRGDLVRFSMLSEHIQQYLQAKRRGADGLLERSVEQYERRLILHALENNDWNHLRTAESIGVPRTTLLAKLKRLNIPAKL